MKSPLVEALRTAAGEPVEKATSAKEQPAAVQDDQPEVGHKRILVDESAADADALSLMAATDVIVAEQPTNDAAPADEDELVLADADKAQLPEEVGAAVDASQLALRQLVASGRWFSLASIGRFTPIVCIVLAVASTGGYILYRDVGSAGGGGLGNLSTQVVANARGAAVRVPEPQGPVQRFPLIESGRAAPRAETASESLSDEVRGE